MTNNHRGYNFIKKMIAPGGFEPPSLPFFILIPKGSMIGRYIPQRFFLFYGAIGLSKVIQLGLFYKVFFLIEALFSKKIPRNIT